ncbi:phosphoglycerate dehydrogenase [Dissulfurirhabdus thermomarina]|uniref:D-3-phosphoglycerate dehydrogenase n=1 Tax=Dissulfurirhabdus thermomarina TaxID=1765737 RepID=A0A6N9TNQ8_DISTH|nr:phosphoglycerate dehydrogenase [Dissulfurirhabdus thermomarina]NDY42921.1 phosphoglycerate dehydrogenase [Dissulfurirhabdus thermomarina]NMX23424.1 phosphoglycerate dehydrogenase [Dissulfurirhabdus thermomarina]
MKVLITDPIAREGVDILRQAGLEVEERLGLAPEALLEAVKDADGLVIRSNTKVTAEVVAAADRLKVVGRAGTGLDNVDIEACNKRGIVVMNTPGGNTNSAAEHTVAMMLAMSRHIPQATASMKAGKWEKKRFQGQEVAGKTLGIIGIGRIGSIVAELVQGLRMKVVAFDPHIRPDLAEKLGVELVDLDELCRRADYISVHTPLLPETKGLLNKDLFDRMKDGVMVLNCARGGIVNEADLYAALKSGKVAAAALDVFEKEPTTLENPLLGLDNFICTPHLGASTREAQENVAVAVANQIAAYLTKGEVRNAVNVPSVGGEALVRLGPFIRLGEKLGAFLANMQDGAMEEVEIGYLGDVAEYDTAPVTVAVLKGLMAPYLREEVNYVNAPILARERGIKVTEAKSQTSEDFTNLLQVTVRSGGGTNLVAGTIFGKKEPRLVRINDFRLEAVPEGHMLLIYNEDRPGVIGRIGLTLGEAGVNIARMQVGQDTGHHRNVILLTMDEPVSPDVLARLQEQDGVTSARPVEL